MKEKEWKKEQKIPLLPVEFPEDSVMQKEYQSGRVCGKEAKKFTGDRAFVPYFIRAEVSGL